MTEAGESTTEAGKSEPEVKKNVKRCKNLAAA
jgi:hypothetical protein